MVHGIPVILRPTGTALTTVRVIVNAGSVHEVVPGTAHFLEHMFFKGSKKRGYDEMLRTIAGIGNTNAYTTHDRTVFYIDTTEDNAMKALDLLLEMLFLPALLPEEFEKERQVILEEYQNGVDGPMSYFFSTAPENIFSSPNGRAVIGTRESIEAITLNDLKAFRDHYCRQNLAIAVIGGTGTITESDVGAVVDSYKGYLYDGRRNRIVTSKKNFGTWDNPNRVDLTHDAEQAAIALFMPGITVAEDLETKMAYATLTNLMGGGMHSMIWKRLRQEDGLCYSTGAYIAGAWEDQCLVAYALLSPGNVEKGISAMQEVLQDVVDGKFDDELIAISQSNELFNLARGSETASGWAHSFADNYFFYWDMNTIDYLYGGYDKARETILSLPEDQKRETLKKLASRMLEGATWVVMNGPR